MFLIRRIITFLLAIVGSLVSIIILALINSLSHTGLTGGQVVLYGLIAGIVIGFFTSYLVINLIIRKAKKFIFNKFGNAIQRSGFLRRVL